MTTKRSYKKKDLEKYVEENGIELIGEYEKVNCHTKIKGKCKTKDCECIFEKQFRKMTLKGGPYCRKCTLKNAVPKRRETTLKTYGCEYVTQNENVKKKTEETNIKKYGCKNPLQNENVRKKMEETNMKKYGCKNPFQNEDIKKKSKETMVNKYGVDNCHLVPDIQKKIQNTRIKNNPCSMCNISSVLKTSKDYNGICLLCKSLLSSREKTKEWLVVRKLREDIPDIELIHNKSVGNECTLQDREDTNGHLYPDIRFELFGFDLIIEVDEYKHRGAGYSCDERRMYEIIKQLGIPCVFIRYNPDDKKSDYNVLLEMVKEYLEKDIDEIDFNELSGLKVEYLFY